MHQRKAPASHPLLMVGLALAGMVMFQSCPVETTPAVVLEFSFPAELNPDLGAGYQANIDGHELILELPFLSKVNRVVAAFSHSGQSLRVNGVEQISGQSVNDYTKPVIYALSSSDGSVEYWTVTVRQAGPAYTKDAPTVFKYIATALSVDDDGSTSTQVHRYHFRAPADYNADKSVAYPLVVSLHAWGPPNADSAALIASGNSWYLEDGSPYSMIGLDAAHQAFEYSPICPPPYNTAGEPDAPQGGEWNSPAARQMIVQTIRQLVTDYHIDINRIYLHGFSMGGAGTWYLAQAWYDSLGRPVAAISRSAGYSPTNQMLAEGGFADLKRSAVWYHVGDQDTMGLSGSLGNYELALYSYTQLKAALTGGTETLLARSEGSGLTSASDGLSANLKEYLVDGNPRLRLSVYPGRNHAYLADRNTDHLDWLFAQAY